MSPKSRAAKFAARQSGQRTAPLKERWYPIEAMRRLDHAVEVQWSWWIGVVALVKTETGLQWVTITNDGETLLLPDPQVHKDWGRNPDCWRPVGPWPDPLPAPLVFLSRGEISTTREGRVLKHSEPPKSSHPRDEDVAAAKKQRGEEWWRSDIPALRETVENRVAVEYRLMRALAQVGSISGPTLAAMGIMTLEEAQRDIENGPSADLLPRFKPTAADVKDFPTAMAWFTGLNPPDFWNKKREPWTFNAQQRVLLRRAMPIAWTFDEIAARELRAKGAERRFRAMHLYNDGIDKCWSIATGKSAYAHITDHIAELRERNRAFKRGEI